MSIDYFAGQTPPPPSVHAGPVKLVHVTGQTGQTGQLTDPTDALVVSLPIASTPCSADSSRINELENSVPPLFLQESGSPHKPIFDNAHGNSLGRALMNSVQTMEQDDPIVHRLNSTSQASTSGRCVANLAKLKEDLAGHNENKFSDLTSVRQGRDESVLDYFQRFKGIKN